MENNQRINDYKTKIYAIAFIIMLVIIGFFFFNKQSNESYYINLVENAMKNYDSRANFDITVTTIKSTNKVEVDLTPADNYTANKYGRFLVFYNLKSKNYISTTSFDIPDRVFQ